MQPADCRTGGAQDFELGLRILGTDTHFRVTATNALTGVVDDVRYATSDALIGNTACHYVAHVGEPNDNPERATLDANVPLVLTFEQLAYADETAPVVRTYRYTYSLCYDAALAGSFYCPRGPVQHGYPDLLFYHEPDGRMRVYPTRLGNVGGNATTGDVNAAFTDTGWVLPYYDERVCQYYSGTACNAAFRRDVPFISPQVVPVFNLTRDEDLVQPVGQAWTWRTTDGVTTLRFPQSRKLVANGTLNAHGLTFAATNPQQRWGGLVAAQGSLSLTGGRVERAVTGMAVYDPATAAITGTTIALNGTGLDVRSAAGATAFEAVFDRNATGARTGFLACYGGACSCLTGCRGRLALTSSVVNGGGGGRGVYAANGDVRVQDTCMQGHSGDGLTVANARVDPFIRNDIRGNGFGPDGPGATVLSGGEFFFSPAFTRGFNRITGNATTELVIASGGFAFAGQAPHSGYNAIFDAGDRLISNGGAAMLAEYVWWGSPSGPPAGSIVGPVDYEPFLTSGPTTGTCDQQGGGSGSGGGSAGFSGDAVGDEEDTAGEEAFFAWLGEEIVGLRAALEADPDAPQAADLVRELSAHQRMDRDDVLGERAQTMALLADLRTGLLLETLADDARPSAEASLEAEALDALTREEYAGAAALIAVYAGLAEDGGVGRQLALVGAFLDAQGGRYAEASAAVAAVAAETPDKEEAQALTTLAEVFAEWAAEGGETSPLPEPGQDEGLARVSESSGAALGLSVAPNPSRGSARVMFALDEPTRVRVAVYDVLGREVALLHDGPLADGTHALALDRGARLAPGVYVVRAAVEGGGVAPAVRAARLTILD